MRCDYMDKKLFSLPKVALMMFRSHNNGKKTKHNKQQKRKWKGKTSTSHSLFHQPFSTSASSLPFPRDTKEEGSTSVKSTL